MAGVQTDLVDLYAREVAEAVLAGLPDAALGRAGEGTLRAAGVLRAWDGRRALEWDGREAAGDDSGGGVPSSAGSVLFALFERELRRGVFGDEAAAHGLDPFDSRDRLLAVLRGEMSPAWFDDVSTPAVETRHEVIAAALAAAWREASDHWGGDLTQWRYGDLQTLRLEHPLGGVPGAGALFNRGPFAVPGSATTVFAMGSRWRDGGMRVTYGPSMRWTTDLGDPDATLAVLPAGQSGHPRDPHYDDQLPLYLAGELHPFPWSREAVEAAAASRLVLAPSAAAGERR
jgi:penicillin amidase